MIDHYAGKGASIPQTLMFDHVSPATRLLEKRRQMFEVQEALNSQKEEFGRREDAFRRWEESLRRKDLELQESLIKFNKFLQENESKRNRALKRAAEERKQREQKEAEIRKLDAQLKQKISEEGLLKQDLSKSIRYQEFMESVVQNMSKFFPEVKDILNRFKTLSECNVDLSKKAQLADDEAEDSRREFAVFKKERANDILNRNNSIAEKQVLLEQKGNSTMLLQGEIDREILNESKKTMNVGQVLTSVENILERCEHSFRVRHNKPFVERSDDLTDKRLQEQVYRTMSKLDEIRLYMSDYNDIIKMYGEVKRNNLTSAGGAGGLNAEASKSIYSTSTN